MSLFNLNKMRHEVRYEVNQIITDRAGSALVYFFLLICASVLATLGLLLNSSAVIIGAMIVAPLTWPIFRIAYAIADSDYRLIVSGIKLLLASIAFTSVISFLLTTVLPVYALTDEVLSRINPTIIDLVVAVIAGAVAAFALIDKKVSQTAAGVAIAASLLPPLCVGGIGLARGRLDVALGGILLASANIIPILFIASVILAILIKPNQPDKPLRRNALIIVTILFISISIPLIVLFSHYIEKSIHPEARTKIQTIVSDNLADSFVQNVTIEGNSIDVVVLVAENTSIAANLAQSMQTKIAKELQKNYALHLHLLSEKRIDVQ